MWDCEWCEVVIVCKVMRLYGFISGAVRDVEM